ncbi:MULTISPECIES: hypothetical protein [unclassified Massilia]|uniref:hypothetical protein n=1 Tax=unclassified Massilia TaxID=2609279 RepID=UPI00177FCD33|nr:MULTISPECIES: hypothetical protein [unclassified Massilia]MBD8531514.1 hypothetical protein [Massilia sp. CFBP 13647]MBD8673690.1 hypothetical protein [Massilia sp. CFBP 13721]
MRKPTDGEITDLLLVRHGSIMPTYVVKNWLRAKYPKLQTAWVLRRLKALEKAGKVVRTPSNYATMICWAIAPATHTTEGGSLDAAIRAAAVKPPLFDKDPTNIQY